MPLSDTPVKSPDAHRFVPRVALFQCRFNHYSESDLDRIQALETARTKCIQVPCAGRINPLFILNAVQGGVDGIVISGCWPGKCHFKRGNEGARRQLAAFRDLLAHVGMAPQRIRFAWMDPADRGRLAQEVGDLIQILENLGPARHLVTRTGETTPMGVNRDE